MISLETLREQARACEKCELRRTCSQVVTGHAATDAKVVVVCEHPGADEDLMGEPLTSREGMAARRLLKDAGVPAYFTYLVKCMPPGGESPKAPHRNACGAWLRQELAAVRPGFVVVLGKGIARAVKKLLPDGAELVVLPAPKVIMTATTRKPPIQPKTERSRRRHYYQHFLTTLKTIKEKLS